jgi:hypothetical protein
MNMTCLLLACCGAACISTCVRPGPGLLASVGRRALAQPAAGGCVSASATCSLAAVGRRPSQRGGGAESRKLEGQTDTICGLRRRVSMGKRKHRLEF